MAKPNQALDGGRPQPNHRLRACGVGSNGIRIAVCSRGNQSQALGQIPGLNGRGRWGRDLKKTPAGPVCHCDAVGGLLTSHAVQAYETRITQG